MSNPIQKPDFQEMIKTLEEYAQNLKENSQIGNSKLILAFVEMIRAMGWSSSQQDTSNMQIANLIGEIKTLKDITSENSNSSKRFARSSLAISIVAIIIALVIGGVQIYLAKIQTDPILEQQFQQDKSLYEFCKEPGDWNVTDGGSTPGSTCKETYIKLRGEFGTYSPAEAALTH